MPYFTKDSLENLRQKVDLIDVLSSHVELKKSGASYKALCPFHDERSPSFMVQRGDAHYHCFGCGAHGDAIAFLMNYLKMPFQEAVESLAARFNVVLEIAEKEEDGVDKTRLRQALESAHLFFQGMLLHTKEGQEALNYLYSRGYDLHFIRLFEIGLAPKTAKMLRSYLHHLKFSDEILQQAGLIAPMQDNRWRDFFIDRITFPIKNGMGSLIGFSARKYKPDTIGGKYINTAETPLFKKSKVLFGLNFCRRQIAKERQVLIVEGQLDTLRLIHAGYLITVAAQGTAFGEGHLKELLQLGIKKAYLAFDGDFAGQEAADKVGHLLQKAGVDVLIVPLPKGQDPDSLLLEEGPLAMDPFLAKSIDYLSFLVEHLSTKIDSHSPAGKNELVQLILKRIDEWDNPIMAYESKKKLARLLQLPESMVDAHTPPHIHVRKASSLNLGNPHLLDGDRVLEMDLLRWLLAFGNSHRGLISLCTLNLQPQDFLNATCREVYQAFMQAAQKGEKLDLLSLLILVNSEEGQKLVQEIYNKKVKKEKWQPHLLDALQKMLDRNWMQQREVIKTKIHSGQASEEEIGALLKEFDAIKKAQPKVKNPELLN